MKATTQARLYALIAFVAISSSVPAFFYAATHLRSLTPTTEYLERQSATVHELRDAGATIDLALAYAKVDAELGRTLRVIHNELAVIPALLGAFFLGLAIFVVRNKPDAVTGKTWFCLAVLVIVIVATRWQIEAIRDDVDTYAQRLEVFTLDVPQTIDQFHDAARAQYQSLIGSFTRLDRARHIHVTGGIVSALLCLALSFRRQPEGGGKPRLRNHREAQV